MNVDSLYPLVTMLLALCYLLIHEIEAGRAGMENGGLLDGPTSTSPSFTNRPVLPPTIKSGLGNDPKTTAHSSPGWYSPSGSPLGLRNYSGPLDRPELEKIVGDAVRFETGRKPGANRGERDENLGQDAATDYYDTKATAALAPASYAINEDIDITDANKVAKAWKSSDI
ncbi:hypothetical protein FOZ63_009882 [Perkinsus olseni]|uniref:Uncharacterized protein n=1 Tax=Perkinsus olseni TaxID=32597 RepID=A0A7J6QT65_PEROL|nr:hypothetical protein FOZ63_009882 [Perkinsus olseni]KAF4736255.1 hypothetical protein FOZ62_008659 [Perkinsus olseni]